MYTSIDDAEINEIIREHREWMESGCKNDNKTKLFFADLLGLDLSNVCLDRAWAAYADFRCCDLVSTSLKNVDFFNCFFQFADAREIDFTDATIIRSDLTEMHAARCSFCGTDMRATVLNHVDCTGADFTGADLRGADLRGGNFTGANFTGADLRGVDYFAAPDDAVNPRPDNLCGGMYEDAVFEDAIFKGTLMDEGLANHLRNLGII